MKKIVITIFFFSALLNVFCQEKSDKKYIVYPHLSGQIIPGKNIIYCASFQYAWNELKKYINKEQLILDNAPSYVNALNTNNTDALSEGSFYQLTSEENNFSDLKQFSRLFEESLVKENNNKLNIWVYLEKDVRFASPMTALGTFNDSLIFKGKRVPFFRNHTIFDKHFYKKNFIIYDYQNEDDFILQIGVKDSINAIYFAKLKDPKETVQKTYESVIKRVKKNEGHIIKSGVAIKIPYINFSIVEFYIELKNKFIINSEKPEKVISEAMQLIDFNLTEKGVILKSMANLEAVDGISHTNKILQFDKPFMIIMKERNAKDPYFLAWIENTLFMRWPEGQKM